MIAQTPQSALNRPELRVVLKPPAPPHPISDGATTPTHNTKTALGGWPGGSVILPELIRRERVAYCDALQKAHEAFALNGEPDLGDLHKIVSDLLQEQLGSAPAPTA